MKRNNDGVGENVEVIVGVIAWQIIKKKVLNVDLENYEKRKLKLLRYRNKKLA